MCLLSLSEESIQPGNEPDKATRKFAGRHSLHQRQHALPRRLLRGGDRCGLAVGPRRHQQVQPGHRGAGSHTVSYLPPTVTYGAFPHWKTDDLLVLHGFLVVTKLEAPQRSRKSEPKDSDALAIGALVQPRTSVVKFVPLA